MRRHLNASAAMVCALGLALAGTAALTPASAQPAFGVAVSVNLAPPPLPAYEQPPSPEDGYIWTPGYWAWDGDYQDYYWVPGTWVLPPQEGLLWTPAYWAFQNGGYGFVPGYWGDTVGYYGGIDYGYGYDGEGYYGGRWQDHRFYYNSRANNVAAIRGGNVYAGAPARRATGRQVSYNGGPGGVTVRATPQQQAQFRQPHTAATAVQTQHVRMASSRPDLRSQTNHGAPVVAATSHPAEFDGPGAVRAVNAPFAHQQPAPRAPPAPARVIEPVQRQAADAPRPAEDVRRAPPMDRPGMEFARPPAGAGPQAAPARVAEPRPEAMHAAPSQAMQRPAAPRPEQARPSPEGRPGGEKPAGQASKEEDSPR